MIKTYLFICVLAATLSAGAVKYAYDDAGRLTSVDYGDGSSIVYTYDKAGNLLNRTTTAASGASANTAAKAPAKPKKAAPTAPKAPNKTPQAGN